MNGYKRFLLPFAAEMDRDGEKEIQPWIQREVRPLQAIIIYSMILYSVITISYIVV